MQLERLDHLVLTVADIDATIAFYERVLGMRAVTFGEGRRALEFGGQKINLHQAGREFEPKARRPTPGSADLCVLSAVPLDAAIAQLDPDQLFYLRSRGLDEPTAKRLVIEGFLGALLERFEDGPLRETLATSLDARLEAVLGA
jgi:catechol 2,3-dioxygenase-like lactoylglutathione lyase family enzyme